jgi:ATP-dependent RNA helicase DeaD
VVDSLSGEFDPVQIAMAAVRLYHQASGGEAAEEEAPVAEAPKADAKRKPAKDAPYGLAAGGGMARLYISAGRQAGVRPQDLVGAIANEAGVAGGLIGAIQITDRFSLVEVPDEVAEQVIRKLGRATIRGKKVQVKRDR